MLRKTFLFGYLLLLLNGAQAGKGDYDPRKHHRGHNFHHFHHRKHHQNIDFEDHVFFRELGPHFYPVGFIDPQRPHGPPPGHNHGRPRGPKPCDFVPPGHNARIEEGSFEHLPPGLRKKGPPRGAGGPPFGRPCSTLEPLFDVSPTEPPSSFQDFDKAPKINKDFTFPIVYENPQVDRYDLQGYTEDGFPVIVLHKSDVRK